jgi:hypothetical protein
MKEQQQDAKIMLNFTPKDEDDLGDLSREYQKPKPVYQGLTRDGL